MARRWWRIEDFPGYFISKKGEVLSIRGANDRLLCTTIAHGYRGVKFKKEGKRNEKDNR